LFLIYLPLQVGSVDDNKSGGGYAYRASKSALNIVNKSMSIDLASDGISCVLLHPGAHPHHSEQNCSRGI
jgi:NAD(P)-dependent dehydrogenase (short-subunit alcohol dehydrogenase family)